MTKQELECKFVELEDCLDKAEHMLSSLEESYDLQKVSTDMTDDLLFAQNRGLILTEVRIAWDYVQKAMCIQENIEKELQQ
ncbi:hypothetical protein [Merdimonas faecis]|uniref:hypothetical protein n=1 Tax=Merdimonas faecis TaxID=1653435 RepID=UPI0022E50AE1|nr:hypothetical protein [Merdimonas faecis]